MKTVAAGRAGDRRRHDRGGGPVGPPLRDRCAGDAPDLRQALALRGAGLEGAGRADRAAAGGVQGEGEHPAQAGMAGLTGVEKRGLSERDICTKFITPALRLAGWDEMQQIREEVSFTKGRIIVRGKLVTRGQAKRADYILYYRPNIPVAIIEAKDNSHSVGDGMQQALGYAETLNVPFVFSSNGDGFVFHDRTGASAPREVDLALDAFPAPAELWARYRAWKGLTPEAEKIVLQDYHEDGGDKAPRYYQVSAVNAAIEAIAKGQDRILLVMATGHGQDLQPPSRSSGGCGSRDTGNASCSSPTATCWSTRRW